MAKFICWRTNMSVSFESLVRGHKGLDNCEKDLILFMVEMYSRVFDWASFQLLRFGDEKYTYIFQKYANDIICIKVFVK